MHFNKRRGVIVRMANIHVLQPRKGEKLYTYKGKDGLTVIGVAKSRKEFNGVVKMIKNLSGKPWLIPQLYQGSKRTEGEEE